MNNNYRWMLLAGALALVAIAGGIAYNIGLHQGIEQSGKIIAPPPGAYPYPYPYYGHHHWGFGFFLFPLFFVFWIVVARGLFWRGRHRYGCHHPYEQQPDQGGQ